jgi:phenylacetate-CoA ligase
VSLPEIPEILEFLRSAEPEMLEQMGEGSLLAAFQGAAAEVPAYANLLKKRGVDPASVTDLETFRARVPLTDKPTMFGGYPLHQLFRGGTLDGLKSFVPTSGTSGTFAFSGDTAEGFQLAAKGADLAFEYVIGFSRRRTLLVNTYPMGLQVPTSMAVANTGVNVDVALAMVRACAPYFEQLVLVSQPPFAKKLIEEGAEQGVDWRGFRTTLVSGGEGFVETWRTHMAALLGIADPDRPCETFIASTMGAGELGLNLFHEIPETIRIIRRAHRDAAFRQALLGFESSYTPQFFVYYPMRSLIEEISVPGLPMGELAVSLASPDLPMPQFRYRTGDLVRVIPYRHLEEVLRSHAPDLPPPALRLPCVAVFGRKDALIVGGTRVSVELVKEALFASPAVASKVTGFFRIDARGDALAVEVQLRAGAAPSDDTQDRLDASLARYLSTIRRTVRLFAHGDYPYPTTYERKHAYLSRQGG